MLHRRFSAQQKITYGEHEIDLTPPWDRKTMLGSIKEATGVDFMEIYDAKQAVEAAKSSMFRLMMI